MKTKVLIDAVALRSGGGVTHVVSLLPELDRAAENMEFFVVTGRQQWKRLDRSYRNVQWIDCGEATVESLLARQRFYKRNIPKIIRKHGIDVYYAISGLIPRGVEALTATVSCPQNMLPFAREERSKYSFLDKTRWRLRILENAYLDSLRRTDVVILISEYGGRVFETHIPGITERCRLVYHGVDPAFNAESDAAVQKPVDGEYILYVSILNYYKYQVELLRAFAILCLDERFTANLVLAGPAYPPYKTRVLKELDSLNLSGRAKWIGFVDREHLPPLYRGARLCVFPSGVEFCPNIQLEMMRSGCPMALSNRGPMPEIGRNAAVYFDPSKPDEIARAMRSLYFAPRLAEKLGRRAFGLSQEFSWSNTAKRTIAALSEGIQRGQKRLANGPSLIALDGQRFDGQRFDGQCCNKGAA